jgi:hypothetical protein
MARPPRHNAEYFYHPADFRNDRRVKAIRARLGAAGYGLLLMLLEVLTDADHTWIATDEIELELLAGDLVVEAAELDALIQLGEKVGLFRRTPAGMLSCDQLNTWLEPVFDKRNRSKNTTAAAKLSQPATETGVSVAETPPVKESTAQNSTEEESKKIESKSAREESASPASPSPESPTIAPHTRGAADVPTSIKPPYAPADFSPALVLPFNTDGFRAGWAKWRRYHADELGKPLGGGMREQEALQKLGKLSAKSEPVALAIIDQAISKGWKDLFPLDSSSPAYEPTTTNPQAHALPRQSYSRPLVGAQARLHVPAVGAEGYGKL